MNTCLQLVDFPCNFQIKVVGSRQVSRSNILRLLCCRHLDDLRQGEFVEDILDSIASVVQSNRASLKHSYRDNGKWRSITVRSATRAWPRAALTQRPQVQVPVASAEQLYDVYAAIGRDPRVKFKF